MPRELISKKTRIEFREYLVAWTLAAIGNEFDAAEVPCDRDYDPPTSGQRRSFVEQYYHALDLTKPQDARKLLNAFENVLISITNSSNPYYAAEQRNQDIARLTACLRRDGYVFENGRILPIAGVVALDGVRSKAIELDAGHMAQQIKRIEQSIDTDPAHAIGSAKELVETCCQTILAERGAPCSEKLDVLPLVRRTLEALKLVPEGIPDEAKGVKAIKSILGNLATISQNLAELRNLYGTGHGKEGRTKGLSPRHARLAVGAATTLAVFLFDTHTERLAEPVPISA
jgi:hypothetical protein